VRDCFELPPRRHEAHHRDDKAWEVHTLSHEKFDGVAPAVRRDDFGELRQVVLRKRRTAVVDDERRLVQSQLLDGEAAIRRLETNAAPEEMPYTDADPPASLMTASISSTSRSTA
jgi:hypothetical protein